MIAKDYGETGVSFELAHCFKSLVKLQIELSVIKTMAQFCFCYRRFTVHCVHHAKDAWTKTIQWKEPINIIKSLRLLPSELTTNKQQYTRTRVCPQCLNQQVQVITIPQRWG